MAKQAKEDAAATDPPRDADQLLLDLETVREQLDALRAANTAVAQAEEQLKTLERQIRAARRVLLEAKMRSRVVASADRRKQGKER